MRAGKLDRIIILQREVQSVLDSGDVLSSWTTVATVRAEVVQLSADEFLTGFGEAESTAIIFRIRYLADITTADRVSYAGKVYNLKEVSEIGRKRGLELRAAS
ncbi:MAG: head-tail adaptor protein [Mesorhizobium sp.]|uniref:phage head closure protein n=1 Tax=Mesorhizobium sp. TaxID=1871066 RepID=UPI000FE5C6B6|nr:phage head closure protein [Mesorhizobium sp.]RWD80459.1 MAG: head-tail adaptor protein [Mesorhizobium sp.]TIS37413.1 MAG: head-tail adaptor protein [Mesorhizobium sp.]TIX66575.1 MAG: head-tail adaptor protein [Mesorhizobium sp.]